MDFSDGNVSKKSGHAGTLHNWGTLPPKAVKNVDMTALKGLQDRCSADRQIRTAHCTTQK